MNIHWPEDVCTLKDQLLTESRKGTYQSLFRLSSEQLDAFWGMGPVLCNDSLWAVWFLIGFAVPDTRTKF